MQTDYIIVREYCRQSCLEPTFLYALEEVGLIELFREEEEMYLTASQLPKLEQYRRMHEDLSINVEGIDAIQHLLDRMESLREEVNALRSRLRLYEP